MDDSTVASLIALGFPVVDAEKALELCGGDPQQAACLLRTEQHEELLLQTYSRDRYGNRVVSSPSRSRLADASMVTECRSLADTYSHRPLHRPRVSEVGRKRHKRSVHSLQTKMHLQQSLHRAADTANFIKTVHHEAKSRHNAAWQRSPTPLSSKTVGGARDVSLYCSKFKEKGESDSDIDAWWASQSQTMGLWNLSSCHEAGEVGD